MRRLSTLGMPVSFFAFGMLIISCARSFNPDIQRGSTYEYREGYPEVRLATIGLLDENNKPSITVTADVVYSSLVYKTVNDKYESDIAIEVQIQPDVENRPGKTELFTYSVSDTSSDIQHRQSVFTIERKIDVEPGYYTIYLTLIDQNSKKSTQRVAQTFIPDPREEVTALTDIRLLGKDIDDSITEWNPITTYDVPGKIDSLKFIFQVTNNKKNNPLTLQAELSQFKSDSSTARFLHVSNLSPANDINRGIEYDKRDKIQTTRRIINQPGSVLIEFAFPMQKRGNYRFNVQAKNNTGNELFKAREFGVKSKNYPSLKTPIELGEPLIYIMKEREHQELMAISDPGLMKEMIDRFWLRNIGNKHRAQDVIRLYYERVEEANKQFSNFKEGWKTDMGMIYILFGPPWYVDKRLDEIRWMYTYNSQDPEYNFYFERTKLKSEFFPFDNYILYRNKQYFTVQYQQIQRWLSGDILTRQI